MHLLCTVPPGCATGVAGGDRRKIFFAQWWDFVADSGKWHEQCKDRVMDEAENRAKKKGFAGNGCSVDGLISAALMIMQILLAASRGDGRTHALLGCYICPKQTGDVS